MIVKCVVVGKGRAGAARVRTIQENPTCSLVHHISGRDFRKPIAAERMLYFVCTENKKHFEMAKVILEHGHHVAIEFPPCRTKKEWDTLVSLACEYDSILHCGLIGLYTSQHEHRKRWLHANNAQEISVSFSGGLYRWVQEEADLGYVPQLAFGRIAALWDLFGPLQPTSVALEKNGSGYVFVLCAKGMSGEDITLREQRGQSMTRSTVWSMTGEKVSHIPLQRKKQDLFGIDLKQILQGMPADVDLCDVFTFLDQVHEMTYGASV